MKFANFVLLLCLLTGLIGGEAPATVDPDVGGFGAKWGESKEQIIKTLGEPTGQIKLTKSKELLLYGKTVGLVVGKNGLCEIYITDIISWEIANTMTVSSPVERDWVMTPGVKSRMNFDQVNEAVGNKMGKPDYRGSYDSKDSTVAFQFAGITGSSGGKSFELTGIHISHE